MANIRDRIKQNQPASVNYQEPTMNMPSEEQEDLKRVVRKAVESESPEEIENTSAELKGLSAALPTQEQTLLRQKLAEIDKEYKDQKNKLEWGEVAERIGQALSQAAAGYYGLKTGYDMSGLKFDKTDWASKVDNALSKYKTDVQATAELERERGIAGRAERELAAREKGFEEQRQFQAQQAEKTRQAKVEAKQRPAIKAKPPMSDKQAQSLLDLENTSQAYNRVNQELESTDNWKEFVGPVRGLLPSFAIGPEESTFRLEMDQLFNDYRKAITGAAASSQELKALEKAIPTYKDKPENFKAKIKQMQEILNQKKTTQLSLLEKQGKNVEPFKGDTVTQELKAKPYTREELEALRAKKEATKRAK